MNFLENGLVKIEAPIHVFKYGQETANGLEIDMKDP